MRIIIILLLLLPFLTLTAQKHQERFESIDVMQYIFEIRLNDTTNIIEGRADVIFNILKPVNKITLDLASIDSTGLGMSVKSVKTARGYTSFTHEDDRLKIEYIADTTGSSDIGELTIIYSGLPADGLIISENKYGDRTFFGDNWPDRARHWLPTVDHPSDKAPVIFSVLAPEKYDVISNGMLDKIDYIKDGYKNTVWRENIPISTKLMVIGVADFEIGNNTTFNNIPVSSWVFPQNNEKGFENYTYGTKALEYFSELIGPYPYEKLAHVQSKTRYGGMENASCIFYHERTATSDNSQERLFAHEVAHQWFGNSVTEENWHHVWLSEGFATYLTHVYKQHFYGNEVFYEGLKKDRKRVIRYSQQNLSPIIDTTVTEYVKLLNANSYQKASWFLHMLRMDLGDEIFFKGLQKYYADYRNSTAITNDFQNVMEAVSGKGLDLFFEQWLWQAGHPVLSFNWKELSSKLNITAEQVQADYIFEFPLEIEIIYKNGDRKIQTIQVNSAKTEISLDDNQNIEKIGLDPYMKLLYELQAK